LGRQEQRMGSRTPSEEVFMAFFGVVCSRDISKTAGITLVLAALLVLSGCWVTSVNGLYEDGFLSKKDPDLVFDQSLVGSWTVNDDKCTTLLTIAAEDDVYDLQSAKQGEGCSDDTTHLQARLVKLDTHYFLDVSPMDEDVCGMCGAKHSILLARFDKDTLSLTPIDSDWLKTSIAAKTVTLATVANDTDTITASSRELKAFCRRFAEDKAAFEPDSTETFNRHPVSTVGNSS
jgi:hypothetical protein